MKIAKTIVAPFLALTLAFGAVACGEPAPRPAISCAEGEVVEYDEDGAECEPDEDGDGVDDEESETEDSDKKKSKKKASKPRKRK